MPLRSEQQARPAFLVEHYRPGDGTAELQHAATRLRESATELERQGMAIHLVSSTIVPADASFLSVVEAESEQLIRRACAMAGVSCERVSGAIPEFRSMGGPRTVTPREENQS